MSIEVSILGKYKMVYGTDVEVNYTCPYCGESITDIICFSSDIKNCIAKIDYYECPECGKCSELDINLY